MEPDDLVTKPTPNRTPITRDEASRIAAEHLRRAPDHVGANVGKVMAWSEIDWRRLFADLKRSMELLADRDPEEARKLLDPVLEHMMEAVHRYEGTVNQVMGDGIMALFGAPLAHEDHAVRACYAALRMQDAVRRYAAFVTGVKTFEYRHGPMQSDLRQSLSRLLDPCCRIVLNTNVDLAIRHDKKLLAIFEVKTGVGPQIFSGIGQLLCYREQFGNTRTPLSLVIPPDATGGTSTVLGRLLRCLRIELGLSSNGDSVLWDGRSLQGLLTSIRAHRRKGKRESA
jgi:hypothetical protein